jgi:hypothetical protein
MAISFVQTAVGASNNAAVTLGGNVTAANSVVVAQVGFNNTGGAISSTAPTYSGSSVGGSVKLRDDQSSTNPNIYAALWLLYNLSGDGATFTAQFGGTGNPSHTTATEIAGLGTLPVAGPVNSNHGASSSGATSGTLTALASSAAVLGVFGSGGPGGQLSGAPGAPWTSVLSGNDCSGYIIPDSAGDTPSFVPTFGTANWAAVIAAVYAGGVVSGAVAPLALAAPAGTPTVSAPGPAAALALAAPAGTVVTSGAATIAGAVAGLILAAPAGQAFVVGGGDSDAPWHIRRRRR